MKTMRALTLLALVFAACALLARAAPVKDHDEDEGDDPDEPQVWVPETARSKLLKSLSKVSDMAGDFSEAYRDIGRKEGLSDELVGKWTLASELMSSVGVIYVVQAEKIFHKDAKGEDYAGEMAEFLADLTQVSPLTDSRLQDLIKLAPELGDHPSIYQDVAKVIRAMEDNYSAVEEMAKEGTWFD